MIARATVEILDDGGHCNNGIFWAGAGDCKDGDAYSRGIHGRPVADYPDRRHNR